MSTTPEFGWPLIEPTDFVTNLPADFESFADAVDDDLKGLLGGSTGQVLTKDSATDLDFVWAGLPGGAKNFSLLNAGGTALTGATTITVSGITGIDDLYVLISGASSVNAASTIALQFNTDTGSNYNFYGIVYSQPSTYNVNSLVGFAQNLTQINLGKMSSNAASVLSGGLMLRGANSSGSKMFSLAASGDAAGGNNQEARIMHGFYDSASTISSVSVVSSSGNFDAGTVFVYGAS